MATATEQRQQVESEAQRVKEEAQERHQKYLMGLRQSASRAEEDISRGSRGISTRTSAAYEEPLKKIREAIAAGKRRRTIPERGPNLEALRAQRTLMQEQSTAQAATIGTIKGQSLVDIRTKLQEGEAQLEGQLKGQIAGIQTWKAGEEEKITAFETEETRFQAENTKLDNGEYVSNEDFNKLDAESQGKLKTLGLEGYGRYLDEERAKYEVEKASFEAGNVKLQNGEYVTKEDWDKLDTDTQAQLSSLGVEGYNKYVGEEIAKAEVAKVEYEAAKTQYEADNIKLSTGEYVPKTEWTKLDIESQAKLNTLGVEGYNKWVSSSAVEAQGEEFKRINVQLGTGEYVNRIEFEKLDQDTQSRLSSLGIEGFNKWIEGEKAKAEAEGVEYQGQVEEFKASNIQLDNGEFVSKEDFDKLLPEQQAKLKELGVEGFNSWLEEQGFQAQTEAEKFVGGITTPEQAYEALQKGYITQESYAEVQAQVAAFKAIQVEEQAKFESENVKLGTGEYISKEDWNKLDTDSQSRLSALGVAGFNQWIADEQAKYEVERTTAEANSISLSNGEYVSKADWDALDQASKDKLYALGVTGYNQWIEAEVAKAQVELAKYEEAKVQYEKDNVKLGTGEYISRREWDKLDQAAQYKLSTLGVEGFNTWTAEEQVKYEAANVKLNNGEYISKEAYDALTPAQQTKLKEVGVIGFNTWIEQEGVRLQAEAKAFVAGITTPDQAYQALQRGYITQESYSAFKTSYDANKAAEAKFQAENKRLNTGEYVPMVEWNKLDSTSQNKLFYSGIAGYNQWLSQEKARYEAELRTYNAAKATRDAAVSRLAAYKDASGNYDLAKAIQGGHLSDLTAAGFSAADISKAQAVANALNAIAPYKDASGNYNLVKAIQAGQLSNLQAAGFSSTAISGAQATATALNNLVAYKLTPDSYDLVKAIEGGRLSDVQAAGFSSATVTTARAEVEKRRVRAQALTNLSQFKTSATTYDLVKAIDYGYIQWVREAEAFDPMAIVDAQLAVTELHAKEAAWNLFMRTAGVWYGQSQADLKMALTKGISEATLRDAGFTQTQIDAAKRATGTYVQIASQGLAAGEKDYNAVMAAAAPVAASPAIVPTYKGTNLWQKITPWDETKGETFVSALGELGKEVFTLGAYKAPIDIQIEYSTAVMKGEVPINPATEAPYTKSEYMATVSAQQPTLKQAAQEWVPGSQFFIPGRLKELTSQGPIGYAKLVGYTALDIATIVPVVGWAAKGGSVVLRALTVGGKIASLGGKEAVQTLAEQAAKNIITAQGEAAAKLTFLKTAEKGLAESTVKATTLQAAAIDAKNWQKALGIATQEYTEAVAERGVRIAAAKAEALTAKELAATAGQAAFKTVVGEKAFAGAAKTMVVAAAVAPPAMYTFGAINLGVTAAEWKKSSTLEKVIGVGMTAIAFAVPEKIVGGIKSQIELAKYPGRIPSKAIQMPGTYELGTAGMPKTTVKGLTVTEKLQAIKASANALESLWKGEVKAKVPWPGERGLTYAPKSTFQGVVPKSMVSATPMGSAFERGVYEVKAVREPAQFFSAWGFPKFTKASAAGVKGAVQDPAYLTLFSEKMSKFPKAVWEAGTPEKMTQKAVKLFEAGAEEGTYPGYKLYKGWKEPEYVVPKGAKIGEAEGGVKLWTRATPFGPKIPITPYYVMEEAGARRVGFTTAEAAKFKRLGPGLEAQSIIDKLSFRRGIAGEKSILPSLDDFLRDLRGEKRGLEKELERLKATPKEKLPPAGAARLKTVETRLSEIAQEVTTTESRAAFERANIGRTAVERLGVGTGRGVAETLTRFTDRTLTRPQGLPSTPFTPRPLGERPLGERAPTFKGFRPGGEGGISRPVTAERVEVRAPIRGEGLERALGVPQRLEPIRTLTEGLRIGEVRGPGRVETIRDITRLPGRDFVRTALGAPGRRIEEVGARTPVRDFIGRGLSALTRGPTREVGRDFVREVGRGPAREPIRDIGRAPGRELERVARREPGREPERAPRREEIRETVREEVREPERITERAPERPPERVPGREPVREVRREPGRPPERPTRREPDRPPERGVVRPGGRVERGRPGEPPVGKGFPIPGKQFKETRPESEVPEGSYIWQQGFIKKTIPNPESGETPYSEYNPVPKGEGKPSETLKTIGKPGYSAKVDLGITDFQVVPERKIAFKGGGRKTNVGKRDPSNVRGMSTFKKISKSKKVEVAR